MGESSSPAIPKDRNLLSRRAAQREENGTDWWWATNLPKALAPTARVALQYGHGRWQIENEGFNELSNHSGTPTITSTGPSSLSNPCQ